MVFVWFPDVSSPVEVCQDSSPDSSCCRMIQLILETKRLRTSVGCNSTFSLPLSLLKQLGASWCLFISPGSSSGCGSVAVFLSSASSVLGFVNSSVAAVGWRKGRQQQGCSVRVRTGVCCSPHCVCFKLPLSGPRFLSCLHCRIFEPRRCLDQRAPAVLLCVLVVELLLAWDLALSLVCYKVFHLTSFPRSN